MKWEERWTYDAKTFKPKVVKVRDRCVQSWGSRKVVWSGAGHKNYFEGETLFVREGDARDAGIRAAKAAVVDAELSSERCREAITRANEQIEDNAAEVVRIKKLLAKLEATP